MLSIGEFSKVVGLTVKALRLYDEQGLLPPAKVNEDTGYRCYDAACVERARIIRELRGLELSLDEIAQILATGTDDADILTRLEQHAKLIEGKLSRYRDIHRVLCTIIAKEREAHVIAKHHRCDIEEKDIGKVLVAGIRAKGRYDESGKRFGALGRALGRRSNGQPLNLIYDNEYKEHDADFETCLPIRTAVHKPGIVVHELAGGRAVTLIHRGPYASLGTSYERVFEYLRARNFKAQSPTREVYIKGPGMIFRGNPEKYLTEIQVLIDE